MQAGLERLEVEGVGGLGVDRAEGFHGVLLRSVAAMWGCTAMVGAARASGTGHASRAGHGHPTMASGSERRRGATVSDVPGAFWNEAMETLSPIDAAPHRERAARRADRLRPRDEPVLPGQARRGRRQARPDPHASTTSPASRSWRSARSPNRRQAARSSASTSARRSSGSSASRRTGGTTGQPMRIGLTRRDIADYGEIGRGGALDDGLPARRHRLRMHELQPLLGRSQRPPDLRDARRRDDPVRRRPQRAAADDDGRAHRRRSGSGRRRRTPSASPRWRARSASSRARSACDGLLLGRGGAPGARLSRAHRGASGEWSRATSTGPVSSGSTRANATSGPGSTGAGRASPSSS